MAPKVLTVNTVNPKKSSEETLKKKVAKPRIVVSGQLEKKLKKLKKVKKLKKLRKRHFIKPIRDKGLILIRHIPHGFYEEEIKGYFEQFGTVTRVRVGRSKRTGSSKAFAYVEFEYPEVAKVAAETMDNYLMFQKLIKAIYIPPEEQHFNYFKTSVRKVKTKSGKYKWLSSRTASIQRKMAQYNNWSEENYNKRTNRQLNKIKKLCTKFSDLGIDINQCVVPPNDSNDSEKKSKSIKKNAKNTEDADIELVSKKLTSSSSQVTRKHQDEKNKVKKDISLRDLLDETIQEDSDDEDYIINIGNVTLGKLLDKHSANVQKTILENDLGKGQSSSTSNVDVQESQSSCSSPSSQSSHKSKDEKTKWKKDISLIDLLGDTIQEDSNDEDYIVTQKTVTSETPSKEPSGKIKKVTVQKYLATKSKPSVLLSNKLSNASSVKRFGESFKRKKQNGIKKVGKSMQTKREIKKLCKENIKELAQSAITQFKKSGDKVKSKKGKKANIIMKS